MGLRALDVLIDVPAFRRLVGDEVSDACVAFPPVFMSRIETADDSLSRIQALMDRSCPRFHGPASRTPAACRNALASRWAIRAPHRSSGTARDRRAPSNYPDCRRVDPGCEKAVLDLLDL